MIDNIFKKIFLIIFLIFIARTINFSVNFGVNDLDIDIEGQNFERILFIPGIKTPKFYLTQWKKDLITNFPTKEIVFLDGILYFYWQEEKTEEIVKRGIEILNDNKATLIIAHSYGGILANTIIDRVENANVVKLVAMASPYQINGFGIEKSKELLETPENIKVPTLTFGGLIDPIVFFPKSDIENSEHWNLWSVHNGFLSNKNIRKKVLEYAFGVESSE